MHTLTLNTSWSASKRAAFRNARFPRVRRLTIPAIDAEPLLPCFPGLCAVISDTKWEANICGSRPIDFRHLLDESGETVEEMRGFPMISECIKCMFF
jgi:hypothetical protein